MMMKHRSTKFYLCAICIAFAATDRLGNAAESTEKNAKVNGIDIRYLDQGDGPLLILVHGALGNYDGWQEQVPLLSQDFRVVSYSQRYYGKNKWEKASPPLTVDQQADDLSALIDSIGAGPAHLVGWSMGGVVVQQTILRHPESVKSAYLFEGVLDVEVDQSTAAADRAYYGSKFSTMGELLKKNDAQAAAQELVSVVSGDPNYYNNMPSQSQESYARNVPGFVKWITRKRELPVECAVMAINKVPTRLVYGTATMFKRHFDGRYEKCLGANASINVIKGATHMWPRDDPKAFVESVRTFALNQ